MKKLYMLLIGCKPPGRHTEQHDIFFGIGESVRDLIPELKKFWPEAKSNLHVDAWREVTRVEGYSITVIEKTRELAAGGPRLFFINLGGYQSGIFDEPHFKVLTVQVNMAEAIQRSKSTEFFKNVHSPRANSHVDDKYGLDVDDLYEVGEILPASQKISHQLLVERSNDATLRADDIHLGYFKLDKLP